MSHMARFHTSLHLSMRSAQGMASFWKSDTGTALIALALTAPLAVMALSLATTLLSALNLVSR